MAQTLKSGSRIEDFFSSLPAGAHEALLALEGDGYKGAQRVTVPGVGDVTVWLDACSEGSDRGGFVNFLRLHDVTDERGREVVLEAETDGSELYFNGRSSVL